MPSIDSLLAEMTPHEKIGQLMHLGVVEDETGWPSRDEERLIRDYHIGAVRIYRQKQNAAYFRAYINQLQAWALDTRLQIPLIVAADCEAGLDIARDGVSKFLAPAGISACGSLDITRQVSAQIARESLAVGVNMNQRPVADVNVNPRNPIIGLRSPGDRPEQVAAHVEAAIAGAQAEGLLTCVKHFPGHGDTAFDSHKELNSVTCTLDELRRVHLPPFARALRVGVDAVMTAHLIVPSLDPEYPATLSRRILTGLLREEMGFDGVVITDSMAMQAIADHHTPEEGALLAFEAGNDLILSSFGMDNHLRMLEALRKGYRDGRLSEERVNASVRRVLRVKASRNWFAASRVGSVENAVRVCEDPGHRQFNADVLARALTWAKRGETAPLARRRAVCLTGVIHVPAVSAALSARGLPVIAYPLVSANEKNLWSPTEDDVARAAALARQADVTVVLTFTGQSRLPAGQQRLLAALKAQGAPVVVVALGLPYDAADTEGVDAYLLTYFQHVRPRPLPDIHASVLADVLMGATEATGVCPFDLSGAGGIP